MVKKRVIKQDSSLFAAYKVTGVSLLALYGLFALLFLISSSPLTGYATYGQTCKSDPDCDSGLYCKSTLTLLGYTYNCAYQLSTGSSCTRSSMCKTNYCSSGKCTLLPDSYPCTSNSMCASNVCGSSVPGTAFSLSKICLSSGLSLAQPCALDQQCNSQYCKETIDEITSQIFDNCAKCDNNADCQQSQNCNDFPYCENRICISGNCQAENSLANGQTCQFSSQCSSGFCNSGTCNACTLNEQCNNRCLSGTCTQCLVNSDCLSNLCLGRSCVPAALPLPPSCTILDAAKNPELDGVSGSSACSSLSGRNPGTIAGTTPKPYQCMGGLKTILKDTYTSGLSCGPAYYKSTKISVSSFIKSDSSNPCGKILNTLPMPETSCTFDSTKNVDYKTSSVNSVLCCEANYP